ncbi:MAG: transcriptional regulator [Bdellovibrionales bacterium GWB1_55_8]|nr:MAG: transcriptional regulator [Bdellovibrionales bacterium GWB1_55_8]
MTTYRTRKQPTLPEFLRQRRLSAGLSQKDVSDVMGYSTAQFVSNWERGTSHPPMNALRKLCQVYRVSADQLYEVLLADTLDRTEKELEREFFRTRTQNRK